jgi:hypothetical protein
MEKENFISLTEMMGVICPNRDFIENVHELIQLS